MRKAALLIVLAAAAGAATLPNPAYVVDLGNNNTSVSFEDNGWQTYIAPSAFVGKHACVGVKPVGRFWTCYEAHEQVTVFNVDDSGASRTVTIVARFEHWLNVSGHNMWRNRQTVLSGSITS